MTSALAPVGAAAVERSPLSGRVILAVDGCHRPDWLDLHRAPNVARSAVSGVFVHGLPRLFGNYLNTGESGLGRLADYPQFATAVRALADDLLDPGSEGWVLESVPPGAALELARVVYPDALVVGPEDTLMETATSPAPRGGPGHAPPGDLTDRLILVMGAPRSGTTWFEQLLLAHPLAAGIDEAETWLFRGLADLWRNHRGAGGLADTVDVAGLAGAIRRFSSRLFEHGLARTPSARWFVEKTPGHVFLLPEISTAWPDAWVINVVRDGRDVARSGVEMVHGPDDLRAAAAGWAASVAAADEYGPEIPRFREVRYESLLADPVEVTASVFGWAGLPVDDDVLARVQAAAGRRVSRYNTTGPVGAGKWQQLEPAELRVVLAVAGDALVARGYVEASEVAAARRAMRRPGGLVAELRRRGGRQAGRRNPT